MRVTNNITFRKKMKHENLRGWKNRLEGGGAKNKDPTLKEVSV